MNDQSLFTKTTSVIDFFNSNHLTWRAVTETWLSNKIETAVKTEIQQAGLEIIHTPRQSHGGGLAIIHKPNVDIKLIAQLSGPRPLS
jgi:hypothetical protein